MSVPSGAAKKKKENFESRWIADPESKCLCRRAARTYMPVSISDRSDFEVHPDGL